MEATVPGGEPTATQSEVDAFAERLLGLLNAGATCLLISLGHRTGLFDVMADSAPLTSEELAARAELDERYVREWLAGMSVARIVEHDAGGQRFSLPAAHGNSLTRRNPGGNMAVFAQYVPLLGRVEDELLECFRKGGGVEYSRYTRFHEVMAEDSGQTVLSSLFSHILPLVPGLIERLERGIRVLDLGCGRGLALQALAARFPNSSFVGYDLSESAIAYAAKRAAQCGLDNVRFYTRDLSSFDGDAEPGAFDFVTTFDAVHDQKDPLALLRGIRRTLAPGGVYLMQDIHGAGHVGGDMDHPMGPLLYTISCMHCMTVSLAQGGAGLGAMWGRARADEFLREAGFESIEIHRLAHDPQNDYYVIRV
jgi:2-polyprenyl-3-methyl-5-hydroxy-6-metoxy-1,4-benzoquinol methylase